MPRQQVRVQQRKVKPKAMELAAPPKARQRRLQPRLLEGRSAQTVIRLSLYLAAYQLALAIAGIGLGFLFSDWPLKILDALIFLLGIVVPGTLVWPALVLALRDRNATPELVQGQLAGASPVSTTYGLGLLLLNTRQGRVQLNTERRLLRTLPEAQVQVIARVSPHLRHVSSVQTTGPRMGRNVAIEVPEQFKAAERFPLIAIGGAYGSVFVVGLICLLVPLYGALLWFHVLLVPVAMGLVGLGARFAMQRYQKRLETQLQAAAG